MQISRKLFVATQADVDRWKQKMLSKPEPRGIFDRFFGSEEPVERNPLSDPRSYPALTTAAKNISLTEIRRYGEDALHCGLQISSAALLGSSSLVLKVFCREGKANVQVFDPEEGRQCPVKILRYVHDSAGQSLLLKLPETDREVKLFSHRKYNLAAENDLMVRSVGPGGGELIADFEGGRLTDLEVHSPDDNLLHLTVDSNFVKFSRQRGNREANFQKPGSVAEVEATLESVRPMLDA
ncbi:MAG: hypothetical protein U0931_11200 [Vulcanimicrobiota bacterium]